jgi:glycosyltransferase involved in cell wall biosynthesis
VDQKKKIILISAYSGLVNRGVETVVEELCTRFSDKSFTWKIVGGPSLDTHTFHIDFRQINAGNPLFEKLFVSKRRLNELSFYLKAVKYIFLIRPDFVFIYNAGWHLLLYKFLSYLWRFKIVLSGQSGPGWDDRFNLLMRPDAFVCLTKEQYRWAQLVSPEQKLFVIPNGVDTKLFSPLKKPKKTAPVVLTVAASEKSKNIDKVIEAMAGLTYDFLYVGDGSIAKKIDLKGKKLLKSRYKRISVTHNMLPDIYRKADVFVFLQTSTEAFGIVYIEALATGLPIVCFDDPIRRELLGDNAVYVKDDVSSIREGINLALMMRTSNNLADKYDWGFVANLYLKMIMEL